MADPKLVILAHKPLAGDPRFPNSHPRGGETSVGIIRDHLTGLERYRVVTATCGYDRLVDYLAPGDVILTWGRGVPLAYEANRVHGNAYVHMVRWWRNVCPLPPGDLSTRDVPADFRERVLPYFEHSSSIVTNNIYAADVLKRLYGVSAAVSYVPVLGSLVGFGTPDGPLVVVTDGKELGTESLVQKLARLISKRPIWIVNATDPDVYRGLRNVAFLPYVTDMDEVWAKAGILIYPNYGNDVCGTSRVAPEAMRWGVPCLANDRAGICETGMCSIPRDASPAKWAMAIEKIYSRYRSFSDRARTTFERYDTPAQLAVFERAVQNAFDEEL